jgi:MFS superfamily sulfate permease-like transporter
MQKLFSMFPRGAPGLALLLLRLFLGTIAVSDALADPASGVAVTGVYLASALAIAVGLMTPLAGALLALLAFVQRTLPIHAVPLQAFAPIVIALALTLLGPGAYSFDARFFARRLMAFGPDRNDQN